MDEIFSGDFKQERGNYFPYVRSNEILTMFSQLAKRSSRVLPADLCIDHAHYIKTKDQGLWEGTKTLLRHIIPLEEIDRNCLQLSYALFFGLIHISLTFSERDVGTALSYSDKNHFEASISKKTNFKSPTWKWERCHFRKLLEVVRFSLRHITMAKIIQTNKLPSSPPRPPRNIYFGKSTAIIRWPPCKVTALQVVRTPFLCPRPCLFQSTMWGCADQ